MNYYSTRSKVVNMSERLSRRADNLFHHTDKPNAGKQWKKTFTK